MDKDEISKSEQGRRFEEKVKDVLELLGYQVELDVLINGDQVDIIAQKSDGPLKIFFLVECKDESERIGVKKIRDLFARVRTAEAKYLGIRGLFVSTKGFTKEANSTAKGLAIQCFSFEELERSLMPCKPYLEWLIADFEREFKDIYVDLNGEHRVKERTTLCRPIDTFLDKWLKDKSQNHLSILGEYGTGKTTLCRYYAATLAKRHLDDPVSNRIPILINLRDYAKEMNIRSLITNYLVNEADIRNASYPLFRRMLEKGLLAVIFDGFDEMAQRTDFDVTWSNFQAIADLVTLNSKIILTCRTAYFRTHLRESEILSYIESSGNFDTIYLQTLNDVQIREYLQRRIGKVEWKHYWSQITQIYDLHNLAIRMVLLDFIIRYFPFLQKKKGEIKASDLYEVAIDNELKRILKRGTILIRREDRIKLMQLLAAWMYENGRFFLNFVRIPEILNIKRHFELNLQRDIEYYLHDFLTCSFLSKDPSGNYYFSHKSFVDYFVARKLFEEAGRGDHSNWLKYSLHREVSRFVGEIASKNIRAIHNICKWAFEGENHLRYNAATAITCMDSTKVIHYIKKRKSEIIRHSMLIWALGEIDYKSEKEKEEVFSILEYVLETGITYDWSWWCAVFAEEKLGKTKKPVQKLINNLRKNEQYFFDTEKCFDEIQDARSVVSILIHARNSYDTVCNRVVMRMKEFVGGEKYSRLKAHNLCWLAGELKIAELTKELIKFSRHSTDYSIRNISTEALGKIGLTIGKGGFNAIRERVRIGNERYYRTRFHAAEALGRIGKREAIPELKLALDEEYEPIVRKEIKRTMAELKKLKNPRNLESNTFI